MIAVERTTRVSAPGKVLVVGGYLVLDQKYSGLVVGLDARFHVQVQSVPSNETRIHVHSPQFTDGQWEYILKDRLVSLKSKNPFVETCLDLVFQFIQTTVDYTDHTVHVLIQGDNDFYSQQDYLERHGLPLTSESLLKVPKYNTMGSLSQVSKTGLGSSAALTTALVGAFLIHFGNLTLEKDLDLIEKMAHLVHCTAQGKIGSGFDVACAAFGTHSYRRFSPHLIEHQGLNATKICDIVHQTWDHEHLPFQLPLGFHLLLGDVNTGSNTPKMVSQVLQWRKTDPSSLDLWTDLDQNNQKVIQGLQKLHHLQHTPEYSEAIKIYNKQKPSDWTRVNDVGQLFIDVFRAGQEARRLLRDMGDRAQVPIEPQEQTRLLDMTLETQGALIANVPGAGGYDAIVCICLDKSAVLDRWAEWQDTKVVALTSGQANGGMQLY